MIGVLAMLAAASCGPQRLTLNQAEALVLTAPNIRASVVQNNAHPAFDSITRAPGWFKMRAYANDPCSMANPCSNLLGWYLVDRRTGAVTDLDAGDDGEQVSSHEMARLRRRLGCN
jgi:hypothetical protein